MRLGFFLEFYLKVIISGIFIEIGDNHLKLVINDPLPQCK